MKNILVTGGAGYIGSHTLLELIKAGFRVISVDNYYNSIDLSYQLVEEITGAKIKKYQLDLADKNDVEIVFQENQIDGIIHFAALKSVPDSVANPIFCYQNNNNSTLIIAHYANKYNVKNLVFSSSCSVYGNVSPEDLPVQEDTPIRKAESPYAYSKQNGEVFLKSICEVSNLKVFALRYFNPVGAHPSGQLGEFPSKHSNNLVPIITQTAAGIRDHMTVFGDNWNTRDGSCIRDYIHVTDIALAHVLALQKLFHPEWNNQFEIINLGSGKGVSVFEAIKSFEEVSGVKVNYKMGDRREGDVEAIYSLPQKAKRVLGWEAQYDVNDMMTSAWQWQLKLIELGFNLTKI
ncbi:UDP-glucose 4-epimerase GalE [Cecembia lonarensis]|uniref:UDP-glucose 4-epimerase n=1 Tax=Cecembia lonarensis (strain CCUG 58316 / KCTC 22772 / LW9) TaxID=1225176 RepID=K1KYC3_CECL9|nr:UDP-glucose 4-epimerase GalE [Cecembia lonarensis]EKB49135.1 UDP-glucose 4-epimerase [Cecembia lonarensis LW9]